MTTILVTGATGNIGRPLVTHLLDAGAEVRAVTRSASPFPPSVTPLVTAVPTAAAGMPGADAVFLNSRALVGELAATVELARACGVGKVVALSAINADDDDARQPSRVRGDRNRECEQLAMASGVDWVSLRPTVFASNFAGMWAGQIRAADVVSGPYARAATAVVAETDIAAVAAVALLTDRLDGRRIPLTGPQSLTNTELVATIGTVLGRDLRYAELPPAAVRDRFAAIGFPAAFADAYLGLLEAGLGRPATVTGEVQRILGRPATTFAQWVRENRSLFTEYQGTHHV
ncbi:nucleoside-diphosphate sugar epimerase [Mycolicibacterium cosmeticum]|uniref:Nucleoside-diphosphate sugar epimerase n=1 Tax=Mycolicibacterium cosmeticum TaxID=258533 RepID=W9B7Q6_MYCCO|nr:NAD(P)H-binding protein [Mycolicibacterium cosmeticum]TLH81212.1 nucleoside-diphosphate sugar epimerase [Mycolicibacterium cosmeticum]CDO10726.1 putative nucleoside-diphosphate sugar epimerase [Mycolicibacterium cosmeticum]